MAQFHGSSVSDLPLPTEGFVAELVRELGDNWIVDATHYPDIAEWRIAVTHRPSKVGFEITVDNHGINVTANFRVLNLAGWFWVDVVAPHYWGMTRRASNGAEVARFMQEATRAYYRQLTELV